VGNISDRFEQAPVVEPVDPLQRRVFGSLDVAPGALAPDDLGLVEADDAVGHRIVVRIADTSDPRFNARLEPAVGVADRQVLRPAIVS